jgi:hypothetical protein
VAACTRTLSRHCRRPLPSLRALALPALLLLFAPRARATECRAVDGGTPALALIPAEKRIEWIDHRLRHEAHNARLWSGLWGAGYGAITVGQAILATQQSDTGQRAENIVGAAASFIGVMAVVILPPSVERDQSWWEKHKRLIPPNADPCATLATAEHLLVRAADSEEFGIGPLVHIGNFAVNIAAGLVLGIGFNRWPAFAYVGLVGIAVGEVQVITQPTGSIADLRRYKNGDLGDGKQAASRLRWSVAPWAHRDGGGASFALTF